MRTPEPIDAIADWTRRVGRDGLIVRSLVVVAVAGCWATASTVGDLSWPATIVVAVVCVAAVSDPDSGAPLALILVVTATWMLEVRPAEPGWSLVLGLSVLVIHVASARAAALGQGAALDSRVARRWLTQTAIVGAATAGLWATVLLLDDAAVGGSAAVSVAALVAVIAFALVVTRFADTRRSS